VTAPASILAALAAHAAEVPDRPLLRFGDLTYSRAGTLHLAAAWASRLRAEGVQPGDRVALFLANSAAFVGAYLGVHLAGAIAVLVNTQYRQVELDHILRDSGAILCVTDSSGERELAALGESHEGAPPDLRCSLVVERDAPRPSLTRRAPLPPLPAADAPAIIAYTSGTTGRSRGAVLLHRNLIANALAVTQAWHWDARDRLLLMLPLFHAHGLCVGIHGTISVGAFADVRPKFDAAEALDTLLNGEPTMFFGVPTMYGRLIAEARARAAAPPGLRLYVSGSAPLGVQTFEEFRALTGQAILERYGMTETIMNCTNPYDGERRPGSVGGPFPGQEARIVDVVTRRPMHDETPGEIQVRGPHVFPGYWRNEGATVEAFDAEGWFNTGDLGWRSADGYFTISGRARELIISGGFNIYPREVEEVLLTHPGIADVAVYGLPDADFGEQVAAAVVRAPGCAVTDDEIVEYCRARLASYKKPRRVSFVADLPRNAMGKVQKHILRERANA